MLMQTLLSAQDNASSAFNPALNVEATVQAVPGIRLQEFGQRVIFCEQLSECTRSQATMECDRKKGFILKATLLESKDLIAENKKHQIFFTWFTFVEYDVIKVHF